MLFNQGGSIVVVTDELANPADTNLASTNCLRLWSMLDREWLKQDAAYMRLLKLGRPQS